MYDVGPVGDQRKPWPHGLVTEHEQRVGGLTFHALPHRQWKEQVLIQVAGPFPQELAARQLAEIRPWGPPPHVDPTGSVTCRQHVGEPGHALRAHESRMAEQHDPHAGSAIRVSSVAANSSMLWRIFSL